MKKIVSHLCMALLLLFCLPQCQKQNKIKIGISQCSSDDWRSKMNDEIEREIMFHPGAEVEIRSADDDSQKQIQDLQYFRDNRFDIILVAPNEAEALTPIIREIYQDGTPVIVFDRDIKGDSYTASITADNVSIGKLAAQYASNILSDGANIIEIAGLAGNAPAQGRHDGFVQNAKESGLNIIATANGDWNYERASQVTDSLLLVYPDVDLIYAHNDRMAIAASDVAKKHGRRSEIKVIGVDAAPKIGIQAVADGTIDATFLYPTEGHLLVRTALNILEGKPVKRDIVLPSSQPVDASNAKILLRQNEDLKQETQRIIRLKNQMDAYWKEHSMQTALMYAMGVILVLVILIFFILLKTYWARQKHQAELESQNKLLEEQRDKERELNEQLTVATQSKLRFFTNVSHDLRTPLTLIAEPVQQLAEADNLTPQQHTLVRIANKNVKILHRLINQILDFRKYENGKLNVHLANVKFTPLLREWTDSFKVLAQKRHIKLTLDIELPEDFTIALDIEKMERVLFNLMSNAFKYTSENGKISFMARMNDSALEMKVTDTGQGIPAEDLSSIFDRFYQVDKVHPKGSGIGLALVKAFVELHEGSITVESELGKGTTFVVTLPVKSVEGVDAHENGMAKHEEVERELGLIEGEKVEQDESKPLLLVVDDNADIRLMIRELLKDSYRIMDASDGKEGVRLASKYVPDLVICDVMMPVMDGMECCRLIKGEVSTSHIPVLMLTACSLDEERTRGYDSGADGYLSKPFSNKMLRSRIENLLANRRRIMHLSSARSSAGGSTEGNIGADRNSNRKKPLNSGDIDNDFYNRFLELFDKEIANPDMNIDALASNLGIGRSQFYRKIKALTNYSPVELVRKLRLEKARELLTKTDDTVSEISYNVGFNSPAYFTRVYRETYGETPGELRKRLGR